RYVLLVGHDRRPGPGRATVAGLDKGHVLTARCEVRASRGREEIEKVIESAVGSDHDLVAERLAVLPRIEDRPGLAPAIASGGCLREPGRSVEGVGMEIGVGAMAGRLGPVPDH